MTEQETAAKASEIAAWLATEPKPRSRTEIQRGVGGRATSVRAAIGLLLGDPSSSVVEVEPRERGAFRIWTRANADRAGLRIVEPSAEPRSADLEDPGSTDQACEGAGPSSSTSSLDGATDARDRWGNAHRWG
jgi:hypothetical protein